jgi:hypothetical protein
VFLSGYAGDVERQFFGVVHGGCTPAVREVLLVDRNGSGSR